MNITNTTRLNTFYHLEQGLNVTTCAKDSEGYCQNGGICFIVEDGVQACQCPDPNGGKSYVKNTCGTIRFNSSITSRETVDTMHRKRTQRNCLIDDIRYWESKALACRKVYTKDRSIDSAIISWEFADNYNTEAKRCFATHDEDIDYFDMRIYSTVQLCSITSLWHSGQHLCRAIGRLQVRISLGFWLFPKGALYEVDYSGKKLT